MTERIVKVAILQMRNRPQNKAENFARSEEMIREAVARGAQMVFLPELYPGGYLASEAIWPLAEPDRGESTRWQQRVSAELGIILGAGFPLWQGHDLINVYQLCNGQGKLLGRVQKMKTETDVFLPGKPGHRIETDFGVVGVGICADNHMASFLRAMTKASLDWMVMPHAWPVPVRTGGLVSEKDLIKAREDMVLFPSLYSRTLGVPVIFPNGTGPIKPLSGAIGKLLDPRYFELGGHSSIYDETGRCLIRLGTEEGIAMAEIVIGKKGKQHPFPQDYEGWLHRGSFLFRRILMPIGNLTSRNRYRSQKKERARFADSEQAKGGNGYAGDS